jgi:hypothetical protein
MRFIENNMRLGRVSISEKLLRESIKNGIAARLFYGSVPLDVSRDWLNSKTTYTLWHPRFDLVEEGEKIPNYMAVVENGAISWEKTGYEHDAPIVTPDMLGAVEVPA